MNKSAQEPNGETSDHAKVVAYPLAIFLGFLILGIIADYVWPNWSLEPFGRALAFVMFSLPGGVLIYSTFPRFKNAGTTLDPYGEVSAIIRTGPFRFSRNPIYVGMCLIHIGAALGLGGLIALLVLVPVLLIMHYGVILREEEYLEREHGAEYLDYKAEVRRWL